MVGEVGGGELMRKTEIGGRKLGRGDLRRKIERETERRRRR